MQSLSKRLSFSMATIFGILLVSTALASIVVYKPYGVKESQRGEYEQILSDIRLKSEIMNAKAVGDLPTAVIAHSTFDFGYMSPHSTNTHFFKIENHGRGPLALQVLETSCKCTTGKLTNEIVQPGEYSELDVTWNTGQPGEQYLQTVRLKSNDLALEEIELTIRGEVFSELVVPDSIAFPKSDLGSEVTAEFLVHSQVYENLSVVSLDSSLPEFEWTAQPASDKESELLHSTTKSAVKIRVTCKPTRRGSFDDTIEIALINDSGEIIERSITCSGRVRASISFYADEIYIGDGLHMGTLNSGKAHEFAIVVRADEKDRQLEVLRIEPPELRATIRPLGKTGAHRLALIVPDDCPTVIFNLDKKRGYVEIGDPNDKSYSNWLPIYGAVARPEL